MNIVQKTHLEVEKGGKKVILIVDQDMPLGLLFDAMMELKGFCVQRMVKSHAEEEQEAAKNMEPPCLEQCEKEEG